MQPPTLGSDDRLVPRVAIVTGATGFIGSNLVVGLLMTGRTGVWCVVRPSDDAHERVRAAVLEAARAAGMQEAINERIDAVKAIEGDVRRPGFDLSAAELEMLGSEPPTEIWHSAASLRYQDRFRDEILETNVDGVRHAIAFARGNGIPQFNLISTAYVAGTRKGQVPEAKHDPHFPVNNWYEESKRRGESLALAERENAMRVRIFRPSIVVGNMSTFEATSSSGYYGFVSGIASFTKLLEQHFPGYLKEQRMRLFREQDTSIDLMPVDKLVQEMIAIADDPNALGTFFHLTNPFPVTFEQAREAVRAAYPRVQGKLVADRALLDEQSLLFDAAIEFYAPYLRNDKRFMRARDAGQPPEYLRITTETLTHMTIAFRERRRRLASERATAQEKLAVAGGS
jgi:thioester reductase-like protein